ncbi:MAG: Fe-S cluster assembly protein SufD [Gemmatimonadota bacterium]|nr:MAG: Fe-S cluster assembly protein SufD [Gemmatimonadota bacterium]
MKTVDHRERRREVVPKVEKSKALELYLEQFKRLENGAGGPEWLRPVRQAAMARSSELGFPTVRDEDWKFTNLTPLSKKAFAPAAAETKLSLDDLAGFVFRGQESARLVFVNGRYEPELSDSCAQPGGVLACSLRQSLELQPELVKLHLAKYLDYEHDFFGALNTAFVEDGGFVYVPDRVVVERPIHLIYVSTETPSPAVTHPRNLIIVGEAGEGAVVEEYVSQGGEEYFTNAVTEIVAGPSAVLEHYRVQRESRRAFNVGTVRVQQSRSSNVSCHGVHLGGGLVRNNVHPVLAGEGAECLINGVFLPAGKQHIDNFMRVEHASPHCDSRQFYNGILNDSASGVFSGRIIVHKEAQKTDAKQTNRNLLLTDEAQMDSKPQLEIYADDVKCTHGATIGQLDDDAIFYLRARGVPEDTARTLLLFGFAAENLERMRQAPIRDYVESLVTEWLPHGEVLKKLR